MLEPRKHEAKDIDTIWLRNQLIDVLSAVRFSVFLKVSRQRTARSLKCVGKPHAIYLIERKRLSEINPRDCTGDAYKSSAPTFHKLELARNGIHPCNCVTRTSPYMPLSHLVEDYV